MLEAIKLIGMIDAILLGLTLMLGLGYMLIVIIIMIIGRKK